MGWGYRLLLLSGSILMSSFHVQSHIRPELSEPPLGPEVEVPDIKCHDGAPGRDGNPGEQDPFN
jgi:hypothetical protein